jgi:cell division protein FtsB
MSVGPPGNPTNARARETGPEEASSVLSGRKYENLRITHDLDGRLKRSCASRGECVRALGLGIAVIVILAITALLDRESGIGVWRELGQDLSQSQTRVSELKRENEVMRSEIAVLESGSAAIDRAIREELDLALPGEVIVRFKNLQPSMESTFEASGEGSSPYRMLMNGLSGRETK